MELYVHIPFCVRKCAYCDFLSAPAGGLEQRAYVDQLLEEIQMQSLNYKEYDVTSIFIGGGTPSILRAEWMSEILSMIHQCFAVESDAEITIEANPGTLDAHKLDVYRQSGINRISLGLQSADDEELRTLGRIHTYDDFLKSYERVRQAGFTNVNIDLMSALPGQTLASWKNTLKKVLMLRPEHISAYSLIIEEGTPFFERYHTKEGRMLLPDEDMDREMYHFTKTYLKEQDYDRYEISNYAKPGYECRHNIGYWTGVEYLGLGLGASSYMLDHRFHSEQDMEKYMKIRMREDLTPLYQEVEELDLGAKMEEFMFLGLRLAKGVSGSEFFERFNQNMWNIYGAVIQKYIDEGLLESNSPDIRLTERGMDVSNYVMSGFLLE